MARHGTDGTSESARSAGPVAPGRPRLGIVGRAAPVDFASGPPDHGVNGHTEWVDGARVRGAVSGVLAAAVALGVGEAVAAAIPPEAAPLLADGNRGLQLMPHPLVEFAIRTFGTHDKDVLRLGVVIVLAAVAAGAGIRGERRLEQGLAGVVVLGGIAVYCALSTAAARPSDAVPGIVATVAAAVTLALLLRAGRRPVTGRTASAAEPGPAAVAKPATGRTESAAVAGTPAQAGPPDGAGFDRRAFLAGGAAAAGVAAVSGLV